MVSLLFSVLMFILQMAPKKATKATTASTPSGSSSSVHWNPEYLTLHEHPDNIRPDLYLDTHPEDNMLVEYTVDRESMAGYNIVETFDRYGWGGVFNF